MNEGFKESPIRIVVTISHRSTYWTSAWDEPHEVIAIATQAVKDSRLHLLPNQASPLLLAKEKWPHQIFIVYDIGNELYDAASAHRPDLNTFAVILVRLTTKVNVTCATPAIRQEVNNAIAFAHNATGVGSVPPFEEDHTGGDVPTYPNPRDPSLLGGPNNSPTPSPEELDMHKTDQ